MQICNINLLPPGLNEIMYHLNNHISNLKSIAELIKVNSSIEHQSAETYSDEGSSSLG